MGFKLFQINLVFGIKNYIVSYAVKTQHSGHINMHFNACLFTLSLQDVATKMYLVFLWGSVVGKVSPLQLPHVLHREEEVGVNVNHHDRLHPRGFHGGRSAPLSRHAGSL